MKKGFLVLAVILLATTVFVVAPAVMAAGQEGQAGNSNVAFLYLYQKDASWQVVPGGAWGKMQYNLAGPTFDYVFNGKGLTPGISYTLIYYPDKAGNPWPRVGIRCLGNGVVNAGGNLHLAGSVELSSNLPMAGDLNTTGAKIWLVESSAVNCTTNTMSGWNPTKYLFENNLIVYTDVP